MPTSLDYSIEILKLQHFKDYIISNHPSFALNYIITNSESGNNYITLEFNETLTESDINSINTSVSSYTNDTSKNLDFSLIFSLNESKFYSTSYKTLTQFVFRPSTGNLEEISLVSMKNTLESLTYSIRIVDLNNATVIGEITGISNSDFSKNTITSLSNLPNTESIFEIQVKLDTTNDFGATLNSFELLYYQV